MMKKRFTLPAALLLAITLCGCNTAKPQATPADTSAPDMQSPSEPVASDTAIPSDTDVESETAPQNDPVFSAEKAIEALDELARDGLSINIDYRTVNAGGMAENHKAGVNQKGNQYRHNLYDKGNALVVDGDYYHCYTLESSKWKYVTTYEMTDTAVYDEIVNARYWWKNHLDGLGFTAYDTLECTGTETILETPCRVFTVRDSETAIGLVTVTLWADAETGNVLKVETSVKHTGTVHTDTVVETAMELLYIKTGDEVTSKKLPDPKGWERPD